MDLPAREDGHIQAVGTDVAGRRQYRYHDRWRDQQDREKFDRMLEFGRALPRVRTTSEQHLRGRELSRERVLAAAVRLIDLGFFRSGGDEYAADNGTFGLATILREHVTCHQDEITFEYVGKSGKRHVQTVADDLASPSSAASSAGDPFPTATTSSFSAAGADGTTSRPGTSTTTCGTYPAATSPPKTSAPGTRPCSPPSGSPSRRRPNRRPRANAPSPASSRRWPSTWGTLPPWPARPTSTPASSRATRTASRSRQSLADLGQGQEFGDVATKGKAEQALLKLLSSGSRPGLKSASAGS